MVNNEEELNIEFEHIIDYYQCLCDEEKNECEARRDNRIANAYSAAREEYEATQAAADAGM